MSAKIDEFFADYGQHHRSEGNQWCHAVGIPLIAAGLLGLAAVELTRVGAWPVELSVVLIVALAPVYIWLDARLGAAITVAYALLYLGARMLGWEINLGLFVLGWVFQFVGHGVYEKRSPAFFRNFVHLLVGPLWVMNHFLRLRGETSSSVSSQTGS
ncbi:MAG: DUF962 domain-containing protein [Acidobacteria bacterium]|nr:DUF962 domain-containing protein [Acidobacteriota bacterium]